MTTRVYTSKISIAQVKTLLLRFYLSFYVILSGLQKPSPESPNPASEGPLEPYLPRNQILHFMLLSGM
jgi:hypothetical protein